MPYRIEHARTGRATCSNKECKDAGRKILKDEIRYGSWIDLGDHGSWSWRHWGCVTPIQLRNLSESVSTNDDIDGWDEIGPEAKDKLRLAIQEGHVADEDWNGDVECNRPGARGFRVKTPKKKAETTDESAETPSKPKGKRSPKRKAEPEEEDVKPSRRKKVKAEDDVEPAGSEDQTKKPPAKVKRSREPKAEQDLTDSETKFVAPKEEEEGKKLPIKNEPNDNDDEEALLAAAPEKAKPARARKGRVKKEEEEDEGDVKVAKQPRKSQKSKITEDVDDKGQVNGASGNTSQATALPENDSKVGIKKSGKQGRSRRAQQVKQEPIDEDRTTASESEEKTDEQLNSQAEGPSSQGSADTKVKPAPAKKARQQKPKASDKAVSAASEQKEGTLRRSSRRK